jgi:lambda repressor-like predicted transcriptional regulator
MQTDTNDRLAFWKRKLQEYRKSGLSRRDFSRQNGVNKSTLDYWFARIWQEYLRSVGDWGCFRPAFLHPGF